MANIVAHVLLVFALVWSSCALAEMRVYLLRGWFGVFSTGIDKMADDLRAKGIKAEAIGHLEWKAAADKIVVHMDAFLNRHAADMDPQAERGTWF